MVSKADSEAQEETEGLFTAYELKLAGVRQLDSSVNSAAGMHVLR